MRQKKLRVRGGHPLTLDECKTKYGATDAEISEAVRRHTQPNARLASPKAKNRATTFPDTAEKRKQHPVASGVLDYFPDALVAIAHLSYVGNEQHNPGLPLHWAREKSTDEADALIRHFLERGRLDTDGIRHSAKMAWRALALLQKEIESEG
jgi:hypothetical protein